MGDDNLECEETDLEHTQFSPELKKTSNKRGHSISPKKKAGSSSSDTSSKRGTRGRGSGREKSSAQRSLTFDENPGGSRESPRGGRGSRGRGRGGGGESRSPDDEQFWAQELSGESSYRPRAPKSAENPFVKLNEKFESLGRGSPGPGRGRGTPERGGGTPRGRGSGRGTPERGGGTPRGRGSGRGTPERTNRQEPQPSFLFDPSRSAL